MEKTVKAIYFDMDGVLANFDKDVKRMQSIDERPWLSVKDFFENLEVIGNPNATIEVLQNLGYQVYILSKVELRDKEGQARAKNKINWIKKNIPSLPIENAIIVPIHENKTDYIKTDLKHSVLVDDYKGNLTEWQNLGGIAVKFGYVWKSERPYFQIVQDLEQIIPIVESL